MCVVSQTADWSLLTFLWCILWCLTSSSERANFFWQLGQRHVNGFSPENHRRGNVLLVCCNQINAYAINGFWEVKKKKAYALVLPVWVRVWVLRWSERENFLWHVSHWKGLTPAGAKHETDSCGGLHILYTSDGFMTAGIGGWGSTF